MKAVVTWRLSQATLYLILTLIVVAMSSLFAKLVHVNYQMSNVRKDIPSIQSKVQESKLQILTMKKRLRVQNAFAFITRNKMEKKSFIKTSEQLYNMSNALSFDPLLVIALVSVESRGNPRAIGRYRSGKESGALGLMQIKESTAQWVAQKFGHKKLSEGGVIRAEQNILYGTLYLMDLVAKYQSLSKGIMAYNIGPGAMNKALKYNKAKLPKRYLNRMLSNYYSLVDKFGEEPTES